ncbi:MAG TPA: polysaccharide deacetylase family protein [Sphingorhabdus sp.]|nr:polysaccharide deacetylase family protein [Sphingorhabdus sp.]
MLAQGGSGVGFKPDLSANRAFDLVDFPAFGGPRFVLTVDTEEEFDWSAPFAREGYGIGHVQAVPRFQALCGDHGIKPCYLVDYPITQDAHWADLLGRFAREGQAEIGVQLHPWVNPPFDEEVSVLNSFACNLPQSLERAKLSRLHTAIVERFGVRPDAYRAGRYGAGKYTATILKDLGIAIDTSVRARFDYSPQGGPDYSSHPVNPYWIERGELIELPLTTVFGGAMRSVGDLVFGQWFASQPARSMLARCSLLERIALTPEGISLAKAIEGIDLALAEGVKIINLSFHSPSLAVGHTPYVRDEGQLQALYEWFDGVFAHLKSSGVRPTTMAEIKRASGIAR